MGWLCQEGQDQEDTGPATTIELSKSKVWSTKVVGKMPKY